MADYRIVPSVRAHAGMLGPRMRADDACEAAGLGLDPAGLLLHSFRSSILRHTAFVDGEIAAMWGLGGPLLGGRIGNPWLVTAPPIERIPVTFVRVARREVMEMLSVKSSLANYVAAGYQRAIRLLEVLGFSMEAPQPFGPNGVLFRRFVLEL